VHPPSIPVKPLRILVADDHEVIRHGVRRLVETQPNWEVCGEAFDGRSAVAMAEALQPDVAVLDIGMPELNGLDAVRQIKRLVPNCESLIFTGESDEQMIYDVFSAGARSYILKTDVGTHLLDAIRALGEHKHYFTNRIAEVIFTRHFGGASTTSRSQIDDLTAREREVVQLLAEGKSNREVSALLGISIKTVETHRAAIMRKLGMHSFADLVRYAIRNKMVVA
jgi:two-component system response regulator NreC